MMCMSPRFYQLDLVVGVPVDIIQFVYLLNYGEILEWRYLAEKHNKINDHTCSMSNTKQLNIFFI